MNVIEIRNKLIASKLTGEQADAIIESQMESVVTKDYLDAKLEAKLGPLEGKLAALDAKLNTLLVMLPIGMVILGWLITRIKS
jgi:hypothetical protein